MVAITRYPNLKTLRSFYRQSAWKFAGFILFTVLASGTALAFPFAASRILIHLTGEEYTALVKFALILFGLIAAGALLEMFADYFQARTRRDVSAKIRRMVAFRAMSLNLGTVYARGTGFFLERLSEDSHEASSTFLNISRAIIKLLVNLGFIFYITALNPLLGLVFASGLVILVFLEYLRVSRQLANMKKSKRASERLKANESEILKGIKEIKALGASEAIINKHSAAACEFIRLRYKRETQNFQFGRAITIVRAVTDLSILLFAGLYLLPRMQVELAAVLVVYTYKGNIYEVIASLARIKDLYANGELAAKRLNDILKAPPSETDCFGTETLETIVHTVELKDVSFEYGTERQILAGVNLKIDRPGVYGFVGKSGSGKSTIFSLLANFYTATDGQVLFNGVNISNLTEGCLRENVTLVLQDPYMFNDTIMNNVRFAKQNASDEEVIEACRKANIHDEVVAKPEGYSTVIGENGATISGGQKQRLEIARAILKDTPVMLFDEATSALDKNNLNYINDLMLSLGKEKIVLVIAHRLGVMRRCDHVFVLDEGKIIADGHHDKLVQANEYYKELFNRNKNVEEK